MTIDEAKSHIGDLVYSRDAGPKLVYDIGYSHGPYRLLQVTKGGLCILQGREEYRIIAKLIALEPSRFHEERGP